MNKLDITIMVIDVAALLMLVYSLWLSLEYYVSTLILFITCMVITTMIIDAHEDDELVTPLHQRIEICDSRACKQVEHNEVYQWD